MLAGKVAAARQIREPDDAHLADEGGAEAGARPPASPGAARSPGGSASEGPELAARGAVVQGGGLSPRLGLLGGGGSPQRGGRGVGAQSATLPGDLEVLLPLLTPEGGGTARGPERGVVPAAAQLAKAALGVALVVSQPRGGKLPPRQGPGASRHGAAGTTQGLLRYRPPPRPSAPPAPPCRPSPSRSRCWASCLALRCWRCRRC